MLYLPLTDAVEYSANGTVLDKGSFAVLEPGCEFCISTKVEHDWCAVFVPTDLLASDGALVDPSSGCEKVTCRATLPNQQAATQFRGLVGQIMAAATSYSQFESSPATKSVAAELLKAASMVVGQRPAVETNPTGRPRLPRQEIIRRCRRLLEQRESAHVSVGELTSTAEVSERTLRTAFNEYFGVGPVLYLQLRQLHQIHRALRAADPEAVSVSAVLIAHGEWEFSRFASRYRPLFGELPSETLQR